MSCPLHSVHLGANQAWHGLGETGGGAGEACLPSYRSERTGVLNRHDGCTQPYSIVGCERRESTLSEVFVHKELS